MTWARALAAPSYSSSRPIPGHERARQALDTAFTYQGLALSNLVDLLNPR